MGLFRGLTAALILGLCLTCVDRGIAKTMGTHQRPMICKRVSSDGIGPHETYQDVQDLDLQCWDTAENLNPNFMAPPQLAISLQQHRTYLDRMWRPYWTTLGDPSQAQYAVTFNIETPPSSYNDFDLIHAARAMDMLVADLSQDAPEHISVRRLGTGIEDKIAITIDGAQHPTRVSITGTLDSLDQSDQLVPGLALYINMKAVFTVVTPASLKHFSEDLLPNDGYQIKTSWFIQQKNIRQFGPVAVGQSGVSVIQGVFDMDWYDNQAIDWPSAVRLLELKDQQRRPLMIDNEKKLIQSQLYDVIHLPQRAVSRQPLTLQREVVRLLQNYFINIAQQGYTQVDVVLPVGWGLTRPMARYPYLARTVMHALHTLPKQYSFYQVQLIFTGIGSAMMGRLHQYLDAAVTLASGYYDTLDKLEDPEITSGYLYQPKANPAWLRLIINNKKAFFTARAVNEWADTDVILPLCQATHPKDDEPRLINGPTHLKIDRLMSLSSKPSDLTWGIDIGLRQVQNQNASSAMLMLHPDFFDAQAGLAASVAGVANALDRSWGKEIMLSPLIIGPSSTLNNTMRLTSHIGAGDLEGEQRFYYTVWYHWYQWHQQRAEIVSGPRPGQQEASNPVSRQQRTAERIELIAKTLARDWATTTGTDYSWLWLNKVRTLVWSHCTNYASQMSNGHVSKDRAVKMLRTTPGTFLPFTDDLRGQSHKDEIEKTLKTWSPEAQIDFYQMYCLQKTSEALDYILNRKE